MYSDGGHDIAFNYQHSKAFPESPRPLGSHGGKLQSHHFLQKAVMKKIAPDNYAMLDKHGLDYTKIKL